MRGKLKRLFIIVIIIINSAIFIGCDATFVKPNDWYSISFNKVSNEIQMDTNSNFKILQLSDIQVETIKQLDNAFSYINDLVIKTRPNLIVLSGDNIDYGAEKGVIEKLIKYMDAYKLPWVPVFGNHDGQGVCSLEEIALKFEASSYCLFKAEDGGVTGIGNYVVKIKQGNNLVYGLVMMDSNRYRTYLTGTGYDYIYPDQIDWYENQINQLKIENGNETLDTFAFFHIPLCEFQTAYDLYQANNSSVTGSGTNFERVSAPLENTGLFDKVKQLKSTKAIFVGHDHVNNSFVDYEGVKLCFGLKSSIYNYHKINLFGGNLITINSNLNFKVDRVNMFINNFEV